jgi:cytochrome c-type biogenesis protein CcmH/NrfG
MGLVRLGRYREAAASLQEASRLHPDQPGLAHALARLLAASPDDAVRDGPRSVALTERLLQQQQTASIQETMAMAFAEVGRFADAVAWQRRAIATARTNGQSSAVAWMVENLDAYERRQPCRMPWRADDPVHRPGPQPS